MISIKYEILFKVTFIHEYFKDATAKELEVIPTAETMISFNDYGLLFRKTSTGFAVLYEKDVNTTGEPALRPLIKDEKFRFEIYARDPWFPNYTSIPLTFKAPDLFYFNNLTENISGSNKLLTPGNTVDANNIVQLNSHIYRLTKTVTGTSAQLEIFNLEGQSVFSKSFTANPHNGENLLDEQIDFSKIGKGRFDIHVDGSLHAKLYLDNQLSGKNLLGLIEIHKSSQVPETYVFAGADGSVTAPAVSYSIVFGRIKSTWKYYIILNEIDTDPGVSITYASPIPGEEPYPSMVTFNSIPPEAGLTETYGTGKVVLFESDKELPIYEIPKKNIKLIQPQETGNGNGDEDGEATKTLLKNLPNAPITAIKPNEDNSKVFSEIYVFI